MLMSVSHRTLAPLNVITDTCSLMSRVVHFEIPADNPDRVAEFYKKVLGWNIQKWEGRLITG